MIERFSNTSPEQPESKYISPQDTVTDFSELKEIVTWQYQEGRGADTDERNEKQTRLNNILMRHEISPDDPAKFTLIKEKAERALKTLRQDVRRRPR